MPSLPRILRLLLGERPDESLASFPLNGAVALDWREDRYVEVWRVERT